MDYRAWLSILFTFASWLRLCNADDSFQWRFAGNNAPTADETLTQCGDYSLQIMNRSKSTGVMGIPPFYLIAFPPEGIPTTSNVGSDPTKLSWKVDQPTGSKLLLTIVDSNGAYGGVSPSIYSVTDGDKGCLPREPRTSRIEANVSQTVQTCDPLGFRVYGGTKPYQVTILQPNSPVLTNVSFGTTDDVLTYINRAYPNSKLMAAVLNGDGTWGTSSNLLSTAGEAVDSASCGSLHTSTGSSQLVNQNLGQTGKSHTKKTVLSIIFSVFAALLIGAGIFAFWGRRRAALHRPGPEFTLDGPPEYKDESSLELQLSYDSSPGLMFVPYRGDGSHPQVDPLSNSTVPERSRELSVSDALPITASGAGQGDQARGWILLPSTGDGTNRDELMSMDPERQMLPGVPSERNTGSDIIIQHKDGGVVRELPPPYIDSSEGSSHNVSSDSSGERENLLKV